MTLGVTVGVGLEVVEGEDVGVSEALGEALVVGVGDGLAVPEGDCDGV